jgi:ribosome biogenesis GTPase
VRGGKRLAERPLPDRDGQTAAFIGSSGVGKSTLINLLMGEDVLTTKEIREDDGKGRHTTTHRQLLLLPGAAS